MPSHGTFDGVKMIDELHLPAKREKGIPSTPKTLAVVALPVGASADSELRQLPAGSLTRALQMPVSSFHARTTMGQNAEAQKSTPT